ncbi:MAG: peptidoglycan-binding domain-containing protein [Solirubrobacteraceae bacterium]
MRHLPVRLRSFLLIALALVCAAAACASGAGASGGGAGLGAKHRAAKRSAARPRGHAAGSSSPLVGRAMWIWELPDTNGGNLGSIIASAHRYGVSTLMIKSSDGTNLWSQFNSSLVATLHRAGLRVCAWQYVYGDHPVTEAYMGADAVHDGANCLIIDAESEYEGKYISAQTYLGRLRQLIGAGYPLALAGFPYVDYHPGFPYSVFLGPNGAQYNAPQMYWKDIGVSTDAVFAHTYSYNLIYRRPIFPLGQVYSNPPAHQIMRFRELSKVYYASGLSWWDWQEASSAAWTALSRPAGALHGYTPYRVMADVGDGAQGDLVVWAQEHLITAGFHIGVSGDFGYHTLLAVQGFQTAHRLTPDGVIGPSTWSALLRYRPARISWAAAVHGRRQTLARSATRGVEIATVPRSASRRAKGYEIPKDLGAGRP